MEKEKPTIIFVEGKTLQCYFFQAPTDPFIAFTFTETQLGPL